METNRYENGKIYKIVCNLTNNVYIGSTCEPTLAKRLGKHKSNYKDYLAGKSKGNNSVFKILENNDYNIILLEKFPSKSKDELLSRERHYIETQICVNKNIPNRTPKEWREATKNNLWQDRPENVEIFSEYQKQWYQKNKDRLREYCRVRRNNERTII